MNTTTQTEQTSTPTAALPPETAERILQTDLANVLRKCKSGRPLTRYERRLVETHRAPSPAGLPPDAREYYDSQAAASAALKIPVSVLKKAKRAGCPAFKSGRTYSAPLLAWLKDHGQTLAVGDLDSARLHIALETARKLRIANDVREQQLIRRDLVAAAVVASAVATKGILRQRFENELPSQLEGLSAPQIRIHVKRVIDEALEAIQRLETHWPKAEPQK